MKKIILTESKFGNIEKEVIYEKFCENQSFRYWCIGNLSEMGYVFHGTDTEWDTFDETKIRGGSRGIYGYGAYFTDAAYKCEEYGNSFIIADISDFTLLNLGEKINKDHNIFSNATSYYSIVANRIEDARNAREYDECSRVLESYKPHIRLLNSIDSVLSRSDEPMSYRTLNSSIPMGYQDISKEISMLYLFLGYDGFVYENQFVIFNFQKLNDNIVKEKKELLYALYKEKQDSL